ncbi:extracellular solute-binding protein [Oxalobacteraceae bacterium CAVE-383]|nr:extracellular solute-binding protein [Oxalobacteraceae bacterium CAVE-383]
MTFSAIARASAAALFLSLAAYALPSFAQDYSLLNYSGADRADKLLAAAKKEGGLTLYTSIAEKDIPPLRDGFEKKYGIKLTVWRAGSDKVLQRSLTETGAKRYEVDAIHIGAPEMEALHREQILQPVTSPVFKNLIQDAVPKHKDYASTMLTVWVQAYNTNLIKKADLPKSYEDLLDPKWKGKLGIEAEDADWFATVATGMGEAKGIKLFRDIAATNGISVRKGHSLLTNLIAAGEVPLGLTVYNYMPTGVAKKGGPIDSFVIEPAIARANAVGIARHAPHPASALLFYEYLIGPEGQKILASLDYVPTNTTVPSPMKGTKIKVEDPVMTLDGMTKWTKIYNEMLLAK